MTRTIPEDDEGGRYAVEGGDDGMVELHLGGFQPFAIPAEEAIKLAALLLKKAGATVDFRRDRIKATFRMMEKLDA